MNMKNRYMRKIGGTAIFPYDPNPMVLAECELLPEGFNPKTGKVEGTLPSPAEVDKVEDVKVVKEPEPDLPEIKVELKPQPVVEPTPITEVEPLPDTLETLKRADLLKLASDRGLPTRQFDTRETLIKKLRDYSEAGE